MAQDGDRRGTRTIVTADVGVGMTSRDRETVGRTLIGLGLILGPWLIGLGLIIYATIAGKVFAPVWQVANEHGWMHAALRPSMLWMSMGALLLGFRTLLWFRYRPFASCHMQHSLNPYSFCVPVICHLPATAVA